ncbi:MAG: multicopper oxidase family protein [Methanocella sp.]
MKRGGKVNDEQAGGVYERPQTGQVSVSTVDPADPNTVPKFVDPLPIPPVLSPVAVIDGKPFYEVRMRQNQQQLHRDFPLTTIWGYNGLYPGPTIEARRNQTIKVHWINDLPTTHLLPIDHTIHGAEDFRPDVRNVVHLHDGNTPAAFDGHPDQWYTPGLTEIGPLFVTDVFKYPNRQPATTLWYHDHAIGITRLNVYAGLAAFYLLRDQEEERLPLPKGPFEIPIVIQDRTFNSDASLFYPAEWVPEFFGNTILANGKVWPFLNVEPRRYRFRLLNGSNARFYTLKFDPALPFHVIGVDGGLLERPVTVNEITLAPAERVDVILDFTGRKNVTFTLTNSANAPFPDGDPPDANTSVIMQFRVVLPLSSRDRSRIPDRLVKVENLNPAKAVRTRDLTLNERMDMGRMILLLGTRNLTGKPQPYTWGDSTTESPFLNSIEIWRLINTTVDTHPIHLHLVRFQILDRQPYDVDRFVTTGELVFTGPPEPPADYERGFKDTVRANPGQVTRIIARFADFAGPYVWHCHILEHEDNEMMRRLEIVRCGCLEFEPAASSAPDVRRKHAGRCPPDDKSSDSSGSSGWSDEDVFSGSGDE